MTTNEAAGATVRSVARPRGELEDFHQRHLLESLHDAKVADDYLRYICVEMVALSSFREVSRITGISTNTLQRWKREAKS